MEKVFKVADIRKFEQQVTKGDISYSRMVELMNEMAHTHYVVNKNCNLQNVNASFLPECTRVEVIDQSGRAYVNWKPANKVQTQMQDNNKTLKVFIT